MIPLTPRTGRRLLAAATAGLLATAGIIDTPAYAETTQHIVNGTFDSGTDPWWATANTTISAQNGQLCAQVPGGTTNAWDASIGHNGIPLVSGAAYTLTFVAAATAPVTVKANVQLNESPYTAALSRDVSLTTEQQTFTATFTSTLDSPNGTFTLQLGGAAEAYTICLDDVSLTSEAGGTGDPEQIGNGGFDSGTDGWYSYGTSSTAVTDGRLCSAVPAGLANPWDAGVGQNDVPLVAGASYTFSFAASADPPTTVRATIQLGMDPYTGYFTRDVPLTAAATTLEFTFTAPESTERAQVAFQLGGAAAAYTFCLDDVSLRGGEAEPPYVPDTGPRVRVNQVGYLPDGPKNATIVTDATDPLDWQLRDADGTVVATGKATPRGIDAASGQNVQTVDFSSYAQAGTGYTLVADGQTSYPFAISGDVFKQLRSDALQFFYIQRSGIAIDGNLVGQQYARPAGHLGVAPNQGDTDVPCQAGVCDYRLDVRGGWYDAGDHGKYVVNGGIATYQLLSAFERTKTAASARGGAAFADGSLRVPEHGNAVPDILDEARWELEFLLRMQVPAGQPLAGMAHHKIHDAAWTGLPLAPENDPQPRELHPPSTAATLNLAAVAAQAGRLFAAYDPAFADRCLAAARTAYDAAVAHPAIYASDADSTGGGAYGDRDVTDEFYWAAAELYLTTGEQRFLTELTGSRHHTADVFSGGYYWGSTAALGRLDLATVPSGLSSAERKRMRDSVITAADGFLATLRAEAYGLPVPGVASSYVWGSNSGIINNVIVIATAYDLTGDPTYRDGAVGGMDYIFGRNALNQSYVTGWGEKASRNQHSRIFANQLDPASPNPPAGSLAGGANVNLEDPFAKQLLTGCKPMFCYVDDIQSYATNEVAINWNSALAWAASFLDDQGAGRPAAPATCTVSYVNHGSWPGGFTAGVTITNTGSKPINGWTLQFAFTGDQKVGHSWLAKVSQAGATVTVRNESYNAKIAPGESVQFGFNGVTVRGATPNPELFLLNGSACG